jgi:hypothetical protein
MIFMAGAFPPPHNLTINQFSILNEAVRRQVKINFIKSRRFLHPDPPLHRCVCTLKPVSIKFFVASRFTKDKMLLYDQQTHSKCELRRLQATLLASRAKKLVAFDHSEGCASDGGDG